MEKSSKRLSAAEALQKILSYCAYQERTHREVKNKLFGYGLYGSEVDEITAHLITAGFLNEERFAKTYAGGKFRLKRWGRNKIIHSLEAKGLTRNCIQAAMREIDETEYQISLQKLLDKKVPQYEGESSYVKRNKLAAYAIQKGFESDLVWKFVNILVDES